MVVAVILLVILQQRVGPLIVVTNQFAESGTSSWKECLPHRAPYKSSLSKKPPQLTLMSRSQPMSAPLPSLSLPMPCECSPIAWKPDLTLRMIFLRLTSAARSCHAPSERPRAHASPETCLKQSNSASEESPLVLPRTHLQSLILQTNLQLWDHPCPAVRNLPWVSVGPSD